MVFFEAQQILNRENEKNREEIVYAVISDFLWSSICQRLGVKDLGKPIDIKLIFNSQTETAKKLRSELSDFNGEAYFSTTDNAYHILSSFEVTNKLEICKIIVHELTHQIQLETLRFPQMDLKQGDNNDFDKPWEIEARQMEEILSKSLLNNIEFVF